MKPIRFHGYAFTLFFPGGQQPASGRQANLFGLIFAAEAFVEEHCLGLLAVGRKPFGADQTCVGGDRLKLVRRLFDDVAQ